MLFSGQQEQASPKVPASRWNWRLRVYPVAIVGVLAAVVVLAAVADTGTRGQDKRLGGDYPAFYGAGVIALDGDWDSLYDAEFQQQAQAGLVDSDQGFLYFAYPPPVAAAYAALAGLEYRWSYLAHTMLMALALAGAVQMARPLAPVVDRYPVAAFAVALLTYPLYRAVTGGQNTALTLLLIVAAARLERAERWAAVGVIVGLMLYKPQFGLLYLALLVIRRRWRAVAAASAVGGAMWAFSAAVLGAGWFADWLSQASEFARLNADLNAANFVSLPGALGHVFGTAGEVIGWTFAALAVGSLIVLWWLRRGADAPAVYALTAAVAVLALPQPLFYEAGLLVFLAALVVSARPRAGLVLAAVAAATWVQPVSGSLGSMPMMLLAATVVAWAGAVLWRDRQAPLRSAVAPARYAAPVLGAESRDQRTPDA